jgi:hypothetical protein
MHAVMMDVMVHTSVDLSRRVLQRQFVPDVYDLELLNSAVTVGKRLKALGVTFQAVDDCNFTSLLDPKYHMSDFKNVTNSSQTSALKKAKGKPLFRDVTSKPYGTLEDKNVTFLRLLLKTGDYFLSQVQCSVYLNEEGGLTDTFFLHAASKSLDKFIKMDKLVKEINSRIVRAAKDKSAFVKVGNVQLDSANLTMKEKDNVRAFLPKYAKGAVSKRVMAAESEKHLAGLESLELGSHLSRTTPSPTASALFK